MAPPSTQQSTKNIMANVRAPLAVLDQDCSHLLTRLLPQIDQNLKLALDKTVHMFQLLAQVQSPRHAYLDCQRLIEQQKPIILKGLLNQTIKKSPALMITGGIRRLNLKTRQKFARTCNDNKAKCQDKYRFVLQRTGFLELADQLPLSSRLIARVHPLELSQKLKKIMRPQPEQPVDQMSPEIWQITEQVFQSFFLNLMTQCFDSWQPQLAALLRPNRPTLRLTHEPKQSTPDKPWPILTDRPDNYPIQLFSKPYTFEARFNNDSTAIEKQSGFHAQQEQTARIQIKQMPAGTYLLWHDLDQKNPVLYRLIKQEPAENTITLLNEETQEFCYHNTKDLISALLCGALFKAPLSMNQAKTSLKDRVIEYLGLRQ